MIHSVASSCAVLSGCQAGRAEQVVVSSFLWAMRVFKVRFVCFCVMFFFLFF